MIKLYSTASCVYCPAAKQWLKDNNIEFEEVIANATTENIRELVRITNGMSVPALVLEDEKYILGFDPKVWEELLITNDRQKV